MFYKQKRAAKRRNVARGAGYGSLVYRSDTVECAQKTPSLSETEIASYERNNLRSLPKPSEYANPIQLPLNRI